MFISAEKQSVELTAKLFRGFADVSRLTILERLKSEEMTVSQLVEATGLTQSNVSNHLSCLKDCGLVISQQEGRSVRYRLSDDRVAGLIDLAEGLLSDVAKGVYECTRYCEDKE
jgi:ArsR family transcriptional regulator, cadmium/lead-responsive transcriptional repressor